MSHENHTKATATQSCLFLDLPLEIRLDVYTRLLLHPPLDKLAPTTRPADGLYPAILAVSRQNHAEAAPILYSKNIFVAHARLLASFPRRRLWYPPVRERSVLAWIRRFHGRVRLDCDPAYDATAVTAAFSGADELVVEVWQAMFQGADHGSLRVFEGVRNVKRARVYGGTIGFEDYVRSLEAIMRCEADSCEKTRSLETAADEDSI